MNIQFTKKVSLEIVPEDGDGYQQFFEAGDIEENVFILSEYDRYVDLEFSDGAWSIAVDKNSFNVVD